MRLGNFALNFGFTMKNVSISQFIEGLKEIPESEFNIENVNDFLCQNAVAPDSLAPYLFFSRRCYTRNLIFKNDLFEVMTVCWESGQVSRIHNHFGQNCFMTVPLGKLKIQNFRVVEGSETGSFCRLEPTDLFELSCANATNVDLDEPIHQVLNSAEFAERAVSLHIYSKPFNRCLVYSIPQNSCGEVELFYTSEYGKLCDAA